MEFQSPFEDSSFLTKAHGLPSDSDANVSIPFRGFVFSNSYDDTALSMAASSVSIPFRGFVFSNADGIGCVVVRITFQSPFEDSSFLTVTVGADVRIPTDSRCFNPLSRIRLF